MLRNPDHITIAVTDAQGAIRFFELLGFRTSHVEISTAASRRRTWACRTCGRSRRSRLLLVFNPTPGEDPGAHPTNLRRRGDNHLALRVDDIAAATAHLEANGVTMLSDEMDDISRRLRLLEGPEGITLEHVEWVDVAPG